MQQTHLSEYIINWLLQSRDNGTGIMELEGREAKLLGSLAETISLTKKCHLYVTLKHSHSSSKEKYKFYLYVQRLEELCYLTEDVQGTLPTLTSSTKFTITYVVRHLT